MGSVCMVSNSFFHLRPELQATAARTSAFRREPLMASPSWRSIDRDVFASRPLLNKPCGSGNDAPLKKLILMWSLKAPSAHTLPLALHTAVCHLKSSFNFGSASLMTFRRRTIICPRQSVSPAICLSICCDALISTLLDCARVHVKHLPHMAVEVLKAMA